MTPFLQLSVEAAKRIWVRSPLPSWLPWESHTKDYPMLSLSPNDPFPLDEAPKFMKEIVQEILHGKPPEA